jgi:Dolichyl-phosphate-mannose-protein mannosyltransferase
MTLPDTPAFRRLLPAVAGGAILVLLVVSRFVALDQVYLRGLNFALNDQLSYISVARTYLDTGRLDNPAVYPSLLRQHPEKSYLYMPGYFLLLAATFKAFGYSPFHSFLPSLLAYVLATCLVYSIAVRVYDRTTGLVAATIFALFPPNIIFAFSAMCELPLVAVVLASFATYLILPQRLQPYLGPLLVIPPMLIRETGAMVAVPMLFLLLQRRRLAGALTFAGLSAVTFVLVMTSSIATGRPSLFLNNLLDRGFGGIYSDAFATAGMDTSPSSLLHLILVKFSRNVHFLTVPAGVPAVEATALFLILAVIPIGLTLFIGRRRDYFAGGVATATLVLIIAYLLLYTVWQYRSVRGLMLMQPFAAIVFGSLAVRARTAAVVGIALYAVYGILHLSAVYAPQKYLDAAGNADRALIEQLHPDNRKVLIAPYWLSCEYILEHHPVRGSVIPANLATLRLLERRFPVGMIVYPLLPEAWRRAQGQLSLDELRADGWSPESVVRASGMTFLVFRAPGAILQKVPR